MKAHCLRCGDAGVATKGSKVDARPFRRAERGLCAPCVVVQFFRISLSHAIGPDFDPEGLLLPHIQAEFAELLRLGCSELTIDKIDWRKVIAKWDLTSSGANASSAR